MLTRQLPSDDCNVTGGGDVEQRSWGHGSPRARRGYTGSRGPWGRADAGFGGAASLASRIGGAGGALEHARASRAEIPDDPAVSWARAAVLSGVATGELLDRLGDWEVPTKASGHDSPAYGPNLLCLLHDVGSGPADYPRIERLLGQLLDHQLPDGRFLCLVRLRSLPQAHWSTLACDTHAIAEVLVRFGRGGDGRVEAALAYMAASLTETSQGVGWLCVPDPASGFRGPGRKADVCPEVTLEALRAFALLPADRRPAGLLDAARTILGIWRRRAEQKPYLFGHGVRFKTVKWPTTWYGVFMVLDALGRYPELWRGPGARDEDRRPLAELAACLIACNVAPDGTVTPGSCYRGFEGFSFGQKREPSAFATARLHAVLARLEDLEEDIRGVDIASLGSSKGGRGVPVMPKRPLHALRRPLQP